METKKCKKCQKSIDKNLRFCPKCGEKIGGVSHKLERRQGHFRIILDEIKGR